MGKPRSTWAWRNTSFAGSGLVATAAALTVMLGADVGSALMVLGVARTALYSYWVPIFGVLFAVLLLGEPLTVWHGVGLAAVLQGASLKALLASASRDAGPGDPLRECRHGGR